LKARSLLGMPTVVPARGEIVGRVCDLVIEEFDLKGLLVEEENGKVGFIEQEGFSIGEDAVLLNEGAGLRPYQGRGKSSYKDKMGETIFDSDGREIGRVSDLVIDEETKGTIAVEISGGVIQDFLAGRREEIPMNSIRVDGSDMVVVESEERSGNG